MADATRAAFINLETLSWSDSNSHASASPFLWTAFFVIDANGIASTPTPGNHRDLGVSTVHPGAVISIPESLGAFNSPVTPLTVGNNTIGQIGVIAVIMNDGGNITAHGIEAGHEALNAGLSQVLQNLLNEAIAQAAPPTQNQIDQAIAAENFPKIVKSAIENAQNFCDNLWALTGADSEIGDTNQFWSLTDFAEPSQTNDFTLTINQSKTSTWTINGNITVVDQCPASASANFLKKTFVAILHGNGKSPADLSDVLALMRDFREKKKLLTQPAFNDWWNIIKRYTPELACRIAVSGEVREAMLPLVDVLAEHLKDDNRRISAADIDACARWCESVQRVATTRLSTDLRMALSLIHRLEGRTLSEALRIAVTRRVEAATR